jgi:hypothetical protein
MHQKCSMVMIHARQPNRLPRVTAPDQSRVADPGIRVVVHLPTQAEVPVDHQDQSVDLQAAGLDPIEVQVDGRNLEVQIEDLLEAEEVQAVPHPHKSSEAAVAAHHHIALLLHPTVAGTQAVVHFRVTIEPLVVVAVRLPASMTGAIKVEVHLPMLVESEVPVGAHLLPELRPRHRDRRKG